MLGFYVNALKTRVSQRVGPKLVRAYLRYWGVEVGARFRAFSRPQIYKRPNARIILGDDVTILNDLNENLAGITHKTVLAAAADGAVLRIGDRVGISGAIIYAKQCIEIADDAQIGANASIYDTDFHPVSADERLAAQHHAARCAPVHIGRNVWLGANAMVLKGVTIGDNSVIAANTVVSRDVPANVVYGGAPGRILKEIEAAGERG